MKYRGDRREQLAPGTRLGPDAHNVMHEVTDCTYDETTDRTTVRTRQLEVGDSRLRFVGDGTIPQDGRP